MADKYAVQSSGDAQLSQSRAAPWFPIKMICPLVAHKRPRLESYYL